MLSKIDEELKLRMEEQEKEDLELAISLSHILVLTSTAENVVGIIYEIKEGLPVLQEVAEQVRDYPSKRQRILNRLKKKAEKEEEERKAREAKLAAAETERKMLEDHDRAKEANLAKIILYVPPANILVEEVNPTEITLYVPPVNTLMEDLLIENPKDVFPTSTLVGAPLNLQEEVLFLKENMENMEAKPKEAMAKVESVTVEMKTSMNQLFEFIKMQEELKKKEE